MTKKQPMFARVNSLLWTLLVFVAASPLLTWVTADCNSVATTDVALDALWIVNLVASEADVLSNTSVLESAIAANFGCNSIDTLGFVILDNVSIRLDLLEALQLRVVSQVTTKETPLAIPVQVQGRSNLLDLQQDSFFLFPTTITDSNCSCALPTRSEFLDALDRSLPDTLNVTQVSETEPLDCTVSSPPTTFSTLVAMQVEGRLEDVTTQGLNVLALGMIQTWNVFRTTQICDVTFRTMINATAYVDPTSIVRGMPMVSEQNNDTNTTTNNTTNTNNATVPTLAPSQAPTFRGPDLFTLLIELQGECVQCSSDDALFDQVAGRRMLQQQQQQSVEDLVGTSVFVDGGAMTTTTTSFEDTCWCVRNAVRRGPTEDEFFAAWGVTKRLLDDPIGFIDRAIFVVEANLQQREEAGLGSKDDDKDDVTTSRPPSAAMSRRMLLSRTNLLVAAVLVLVGMFCSS